MKRYFIGMVVAIAAVAAAGCGDDGSGCPSGTVPRGDGCVEVSEDGGSPDDDGGTGEVDANFTCMEGAADPIDGVDQDCDGFDGVAADQLYVSPDGDDTNTGTPSAPLRTLSRALALGPETVIVALGTYEEDLAIPDFAKSFHGGYTPGTWERTDELSVIQVGDGPLRFGDGAASDVTLTLDHLEVRAPDATEPGESSVAVVAAGGRLHVTGSRIVAGRGAQGEDGAEGSTGAPGADGVPGAKCAEDGAGECVADMLAPGGASVRAACAESTRSGSGGASRQLGNAAPTGAAGGATPGSLGGAGGSGEPGEPGSRGEDGAGDTGLGALSVTELYVPSIAEDGTGGFHGNGGGGGGGAYSYAVEECSPTEASIVPPGGGGGSGGSGGCAGGGGGGGQGGGASIGILAAGAEILVEDSEIVTTGGGRGGRGGTGGPGGAGGLAGAGGARLCSTPGTSSDNRYGHAGGAGGAGGKAGDGGHGGGGSGGPSLGIVLLDGATAETTTASFDVGAAGLGGASDGNGGSAGMQQEVLDVP